MATPAHTHIVECNTFEFFVTLGEKYHKVVVKQTTRFDEYEELAELFPNGSITTRNATAPLCCKTPADCVNWVAPKILAKWTNIK